MRQYNKFYDKAAWKKARNACLARAMYEDQLEKRAGRMKPADTVHHIFPLESYPEYGLQPWNLISISNETHELLHNRATGQLSPLGWALLIETAEKHNIPISRKILIVGLPGSGKTTYARRNLGSGICYDMDAISASFRLKREHEERHQGARKMARDMFTAFCQNANKYSGLVLIIQTAPTIEELANINPHEVVYIKSDFSRLNKKRGDYESISKARMGELKERLSALVEYCQYNNIPVTEVG